MGNYPWQVGRVKPIVRSRIAIAIWLVASRRLEAFTLLSYSASLVAARDTIGEDFMGS